MLGTFPLVAQGTKDAAMEAYRAAAPIAGDSEILDLLAKEESDTLEFKSSLRWDIRRGNVNKELEKEVVGAVVAFLNSHGGTLLIGVDDAGDVLGIERDYKTFGKKSWDGFALHMVNLLYSNYGSRDLSQLIRITRHTVDGKDVCQVEVNPCPEPVYVKLRNDSELWVRINASSQPLSPRETVAYVGRQWPQGGEGIELRSPNDA